MQLCQWILSGLPPQPTWWSPKRSAPDLQTEHIPLSSNIWSPSQYCKQKWNSRSCRWRPRDGEGMTSSQSPAWWIAEERARDLDRVSGAEASGASKEAWSMARERLCWIRGTSISWRRTQPGLPAAWSREPKAYEKWSWYLAAWPRTSEMRGWDWQKEPMYAAGACRAACWMLTPPKEDGREALSQAQSDSGPQRGQTECLALYSQMN